MTRQPQTSQRTLDTGVHLRSDLDRSRRVLYVEDEVVDGAREAIERFRDLGLALRFVTNTTSRSRDSTLEKLSRLGFSVAEHELVTPAALAVNLCRKHGYRRVALIMNEEVKRDFAGLAEADEAEAVIIGDLGSAFGYDVLNRAFRQVMNGAELIALQESLLDARRRAVARRGSVRGRDRVCNRPAGVRGRQAGSRLLRRGACRTRDKRERGSMIGDDVESDIGGALRVGLAAILVRTGKYREERLRESGVQPTAVVNSIADVPRLVDH